MGLPATRLQGSHGRVRKIGVNVAKAVSLYYETAFVIMRHSKKSEMEFRNERDKKKLLCCISKHGGYGDTVLSGVLFS